MKRPRNPRGIKLENPIFRKQLSIELYKYMHKKGTGIRDLIRGGKPLKEIAEDIFVLYRLSSVILTKKEQSENWFDISKMASTLMEAGVNVCERKYHAENGSTHLPLNDEEYGRAERLLKSEEAIPYLNPARPGRQVPVLQPQS